MARAYPIGARRLMHNGYIHIKVSDSHRGWRWEHHVVWEAANGPIPDGSVLHHRNHDRADNRLENLEMCASNGAHISEHHADQSREQCYRMHDIWRGSKMPESAKAKISAANKARPRTPERIAERVAKLKGRPPAAEHGEAAG